MRAAVVAAVLATGVLTPVSAQAAPTPAPRPTTWTSLTTPPVTDPSVTAELFRQVAVLADGGAFAVGAVQQPFAGSASYDPLIERLDGGSWSRMTVPPYESGSPDEQFAGVTAVAADDAWAVGHRVPTVAPSRRAPYAVHFDGTAWRSVAVPRVAATTEDAALQAVAARATDDVWAVGYAGSAPAAWHWDGTAWSGTAVRVAGCTTMAPVHLAALSVTPAGAVYAGGDCTTPAGAHVAVVARMERPARWRVVARVASTAGVVDLASDAAGTVSAVGTQRVDGRIRPFLLSGAADTWTTRFRPAPTSTRSEQVSGVALTPQGVTLVGETDTPQTREPFAATWNGTRWLPAAVTTPNRDTGYLTAVDATSTGPVVAIGQYVGPRGVTVGFSASPEVQR